MFMQLVCTQSEYKVSFLLFVLVGDRGIRERTWAFEKQYIKEKQEVRCQILSLCSMSEEMSRPFPIRQMLPGCWVPSVICLLFSHTLFPVWWLLLGLFHFWEDGELNTAHGLITILCEALHTLPLLPQSCMIIAFIFQLCWILLHQLDTYQWLKSF